MAIAGLKALWSNRDGRVTLLLLGGLVLLIASLVVAALVLGARERTRTLAEVELRLALQSDQAAKAVSAWLREKDRALRQAARNPSLQLYAGLPEADPGAQAAGDYARTLLMVTAEQVGFLHREPVSANLTPHAGGLAFLDAAGRPRLAVGSWPEELGDPSAAAPTQAGRRLGLADDALWLIWREPVAAAQHSEGGPAGWLLAWTRIDPILPSLLARAAAEPGEAGQVAIIARTQAGLRALTPLAGLPERAPWTVSVALPDVMAATNESGRLVPTRRADGRAVLAFAQAVSGSDGWYVLAERDSESVLAPVQRATLRFLGFSLLIVAALGLLMLLFWRHAATRRLAETQAEQTQLIARLARQSRFLEAATDAQPTEILVIDRRGIIRFANRRLREELGAESTEEVLDKPIEAVLGVQSGRGLRLVAEAAFEEGPLQDTQEVETEDGERRLYVINAVPLKAGEALDDEVCLLVREEVTSFVEERERRERTLKRLVATLAALIDARDPYAAKQSERVVEVASALAQNLNLTLYETEAVEIAGRLMNIGKMLVPREILVKKGRLSDEELALVRDAMKKSADLLTGVEFDGPVVETLRQLHARVDGTGDPPLKGDEILITARILAVANAFVAMISPRAHRKGLSIDEALAELQKEAGTRFDRGVVAALAHQIENLDGRRRWARFAEMPEGVEEFGG